MPQEEKRTLAEVYLDNVKQYPLPMPSDEVLEADALNPNAVHFYEHYELSINPKDQDIGEVKVRLYIDKNSSFSCRSKEFLDHVEVHLRKKDDHLKMDYNGAFARVIIQNSIVRASGFAGHCSVIATNLTDCAMFGGEVHNFDQFCARKMKDTVTYKNMLFSTSYITESVLSPGGQIWNSQLHESDLQIYPKTELDEEGDEVPTYFLNGVKAGNLNIHTRSEDCSAPTILDSIFAEVSIEYTQRLFAVGQKLTNVDLVGNEFQLDGRLSVFDINLPKVDLVVSRKNSAAWNVFATFGDRGWTVTDTADPLFYDHLRNMIELAGEEHVDSCIQYAKDCLTSRTNLLNKIKTNQSAREGHD